MHVCMHVGRYVCMYACMYACMYVGACTGVSLWYSVLTICVPGVRGSLLYM